MRAARWIVIATALVAAATALHLLMSPGGGRSRPASVPSGSRPNGATPSGPPQEQIDAESRDAMRKFLRQSAQDEE